MNKKPLSANVSINRTLWAFAVREFEIINEHMDLAGVPKEIDGEKLSAGQRVIYYVVSREDCEEAITKAAGHTTH